MNDNAVNVQVTANTAPLRAGMDAAPRIVEQATQRMRLAFTSLRDGTNNAMQDMKGQVTDNVRGMAGSFGGLVDVVASAKGGLVALAGIAALMGFSKAVNATADMTEAAMDMARALGISTNEAGVLIATMEDLGASPGELQAAGKGLSRQLRENEADMNALGLATRDAQGNFRPMAEMLVDGVEVLNQYAEGADRAQVSQTIFGRGMDASSKLLLLNAEAVEENRKAVQELGLEAGANSVKAWQAFDAAGDRAKLGIKGMTKAIGDSLMPVMTTLIDIFNAAMPAAIVVVRGALSGLTAGFLYVKNGVVILWETIKAFVVSVAEPIRAVVEAVGRAMVGDFAGAGAALKGVVPTITAAWTGAMDKMLASSKATSEQVKALFSEDTAPGAGGPKSGGKRAPGKAEKPEKAAKEAKDAAEVSMMPAFREQLEQEKLAQAQRDALREYDKAQEVEFWRSKLQVADLGAKDRLAIQTTVARLEVDVLRDTARKAQALDREAIKAREGRSLGAIEAAQQEARAQHDIGLISYQQLLTLEQQYEQQRAEARRVALEARLATIDPERDPVTYAQVSQQIEELERQHQLQMQAIRGAVTADAVAPIGRTWQAAESAMATAIGNMIQRQQTWRQAMASTWQAVRGTVVSELAKIMAAKVAAWAKERLLSLAGIATNATVAGSGAAASQASIPYVGPILALAAMAAVMAAVMGTKSSVPSARSGFDIPPGVNPMTQLHEREMVLPAEQAQVVRDMAETGGANGAQIVIHASPTDFIKAGDLAKLLKQMNRDFVFTR